MVGGAISGYCATGRRAKADAAEDHEHDRDDGGENRPVDEEMRDAHRLVRPSVLGPARCRHRRRRRPCSCGVTFCPGRARIRPLTMTRSSGAEPALDHAQVVRRAGPSVTYFCATVLSASTTSTYLRACSVPIAASGTSKRLVRRRGRHADAAEHAGREDAVRIGEHGAAADGAGGAVDDVVDEIHAAVVREIRLVDELERHLRRRRRGWRRRCRPSARRS